MSETTLLGALGAELSIRLPDWNIDADGSRISLDKRFKVAGGSYLTELELSIEGTELQLEDIYIVQVLETWPLTSLTLVEDLVQYLSDYREYF